MLVIRTHLPPGQFGYLPTFVDGDFKVTLIWKQKSQQIIGIPQESSFVVLIC
jgi:hypothetical protein